MEGEDTHHRRALPGRDDGSIRITLRDVYEKVEGIERNVAMLVLGAADGKASSQDHETRLRVIEKRVWAIPSAAALLAVASLIVSLLSLNSGRTASPSIPQTLRTPSTVTAPVKAATRPHPLTVATSRTTPASPAPGTVATSPSTTSPRPPTTRAPVTVPPVVTVPNPVQTILARLGRTLP